MKTTTEKQKAKNGKLKSEQTAGEAKTTEAAPAAPRVVKQSELLNLAVEDLVPDPDQPRRHFDAEKMKELEESIRALGIQQPLLCRKVLADGHQAVMLVDGERRWRAAKGVGLTVVPVLLREFDPGEILGTQITANQQRENLTVLEEAEAYRRQIDSGEHTAESLYKAIGISRGTLFSRLALLKVQPDVKEAMLAGEISTSVAGLIAAVPDAEKQLELLEEVKATEYDPPESFRDVQERIEKEFCVQLSAAKFDKEDATLVVAEWEVSEKAESGKQKTEIEEGRNRAVRLKGKEPIIPAIRSGSRAVCDMKVYPKNYDPWRVWSGDQELISPNEGKAAKGFAVLVNGGKALTVVRVKGGACGDCPFRSGNMPQMPDAAKRPNICTQPGCYHEKVLGHWKRKGEQAKADGKTVLDATTYKRTKNQYVEADGEDWMGGQYTTWRKLLGKQAPDAILAVTADGLIEVYARAAALAAAKKKGVKLRNEEQSPEQVKAEREREEAKKARAKERVKFVASLGEKLGVALEGLPDKDAWAFLLTHRPEGAYGDRAALHAATSSKVKTDKGRVLARYLATNCYPLSWNGDWVPTDLKIWARLGLDLPALEKAAQKTAEGKTTKGKTEKRQGTGAVQNLAEKPARLAKSPAKKKAMVKK